MTVAVKNKDVNNVEQEEKKKEIQEANWQGRVVYVVVAAAITVALATLVIEITYISYEILKDKLNHTDHAKLSEEAEKVFSKELVAKIQHLEKINGKLIIKRLLLTNKDEQQVLNQLENKFNLSKEELQEILFGAHVLLEDDGCTYQEWSKKLDVQKRISSHSSNDKQFGVRGKVIKELLFSKMEKEGKTYTWFQLENHPVSFGHVIRHTIDYIKYKSTGLNQGPYGSTKATDRQPLLISKKEN